MRKHYIGFIISCTVLICHPAPSVAEEEDAGGTTPQISIFKKKSFTPCTDSSQCNVNEGFVCKDNRCDCAYDVLTYDPETRRCISSVGGQCGFFIGSPNSTMAHCPENSMCVWNKDAFKPSYQYIEKYCICMSGYYKDAGSGKCVPYAKFSEECNETRRCDVETDLICLKSAGTCQCPFGSDQFYDAEQQKCISFVGGNCTMYCVENSFCENYNPEASSTYRKGWNNGISEPNRDYSSKSICQCQPGYEPSKDRRCKLIPPGYNSPCYGEGESCDTSKNLLCIDKVCQCMNPLHQSYNYDLGRCIGSVGDICEPSLKESCVTNAQCVKNETSGNHVCQCKKGYSGTPSRKCMKGFGEKCENELCNVFSGMACINKTCSCLDSLLTYDEAKMACVSSVGAPCGKVYFPIEMEELSLSGHVPSSMRHPYITNSIRNQYMQMRAMCMECDGYHVGCPSGSVCTSETELLMVVRGKEKRKCVIPST